MFSEAVSVTQHTYGGDIETKLERIAVSTQTRTKINNTCVITSVCCYIVRDTRTETKKC